MLNLGTGELLLIALVALIVLGPSKLPEAARQVGHWMGELRRLSSGFQSELRDALKEPVDGTPPSATHSATPPSAAPPSAAPPPATASVGGAMAAPRRPERNTVERTDGAEPGTNGSTPTRSDPA